MMRYLNQSVRHALLTSALAMALALPLRADDWKEITPWLTGGRTEIPAFINTVLDEGKDLPGGRLAQGTNYEYKVLAVDEDFQTESNIATNTPRKVVVLVRGWGPQSANYWINFTRCLTDDQFEVWDATGVMDCTRSVNWNVTQLE